MISRSYAWLDESIEHSDADCARASALAKKWSSLMTEEEMKVFNRRREYDDYDPYEDCECPACLAADEPGCPNCEVRKAHEQERAERDLEIELIEDKLDAIGARIMRPYEHWNEDERYMEYMETRYDY